MYASLPAIIYIKYEKPMVPSGNCLERAYILSLAIPDSVVVTGTVEINGERDFHYWVEKGETCYDPTNLTETDKDLYYSVNGIENTTIISREELSNTGFIKYCVSRKMSDYLTDFRYQNSLDAVLPLVLNGARYSYDENYKWEIDNYLNRIGYYKLKEEKAKQPKSLK